MASGTAQAAMPASRAASTAQPCQAPRVTRVSAESVSHSTGAAQRSAVHRLRSAHASRPSDAFTPKQPPANKPKSGCSHSKPNWPACAAVRLERNLLTRLPPEENLSGRDRIVAAHCVSRSTGSPKKDFSRLNCNTESCTIATPRISR